MSSRKSRDRNTGYNPELRDLHRIALNACDKVEASVKVAPNNRAAYNEKGMQSEPEFETIVFMRTEHYDADPRELPNEQRLKFNQKDAEHDGRNWFGRLISNLQEAHAQESFYQE